MIAGRLRAQVLQIFYLPDFGSNFSQPIGGTLLDVLGVLKSKPASVLVGSSLVDLEAAVGLLHDSLAAAESSALDVLLALGDPASALAPLAGTRIGCRLGSIALSGERLLLSVESLSLTPWQSGRSWCAEHILASRSGRSPGGMVLAHKLAEWNRADLRAQRRFEIGRLGLLVHIRIFSTTDFGYASLGKLLLGVHGLRVLLPEEGGHLGRQKFVGDVEHHLLKVLGALVSSHGVLERSQYAERVTGCLHVGKFL